MNTRTKAFDFPVSVRWLAGKRTIASVSGKDDLEVATPPEFNGGVEGVWSPEDLFVGSVATCFTVTLVSATRRHEIPLRGLEVDGSGRVTRRDDGRFGFTDVTLDVRLDTDPGFEQLAAEAAHEAEHTCLVAVSLDVPVHLDLDVRTAQLLEAPR